MSFDSNDARTAPAADAASLFGRAAAADRRTQTRLTTAIDDFFLPQDDRLDDRTRAAVTSLLSAAVREIEHEVAGHAAHQLMAQGRADLADAIIAAGPALLERLFGSGLLRDNQLMGALLDQVRQDLLDDALIGNRVPGTPRLLLPRLTQSDDGVVAAAAVSYMRADSRRRTPGGGRHGDVPAPLHRRLVWGAAAVLREAALTTPVQQASVDHALVAAAKRSLSARDDGDRLDAAALRLAVVIDAQAEALGTLLVEALADGRAALFIAVLAHALSIDVADARAMTLDPTGDRLWLALRVLNLDRATIARIGLSLADADPRRDIEAFGDALDTIAAVPVEEARGALVPLTLHPEFRAALRALDRAPGRGGER